jgi:hypothetical protein
MSNRCGSISVKKPVIRRWGLRILLGQMLDNKNKAALAKNLVSGLASLLIGLTPQY